MAFDNNFTAVTGATYTAAQYNTHTRDNFTALWVFTTAGDMIYATGADAASRLALVVGGVLYGGASAPVWLAKPASLGILQNDNGGVPSYHTGGEAYQSLRKNAANSALEWGDFLMYRQGGGDVIWTAQGGNKYSLKGVVAQTGSKRVSVETGAGSAAVTYPVSFATLANERPIIFLTPNISSSESYAWGVGYTDDTVTGFTIHLRFNGDVTGDYTVSWLAISAISTYIPP